MALPSVVGSPTSANVGTTAATTLSVTLPTFTAEGNMYAIVVLSSSGGASVPTADPTANGFSIVGALRRNTNGTTLGVWSKPVTSADSGLSVSVTYAAAQTMSLLAFIVRDCGGVGGNILNPTTDSAVAASTTATLSSLNPAQTSGLLLGISSVRDNNVTGIPSQTTPSGWTLVGSSSSGQVTGPVAVNSTVWSLTGYSSPTTSTTSTISISSFSVTMVLEMLPVKPVPQQQARRRFNPRRVTNSRRISVVTPGQALAANPRTTARARRLPRFLVPIRRTRSFTLPTVDDSYDFEYGTIGRWTAGGSVPPTLSNDTTHPATGSRGMLITWGAGGVLPLAQLNLNGLQVGTTYRVTGTFYIPSGSPSVAWVIGGGGSLGWGTTKNDTLETLTWTFQATATSLALQIWPNGTPSAGQQAWVDNISIVPASWSFLRQAPAPRLRPPLRKRGQVAFPVPTQTAPVSPNFVAVSLPKRRGFAGLLRRRTGAPPSNQPLIPQSVGVSRPRRRGPRAQDRGRTAMPPMPQVTVVPPAYVPQTLPKRSLRTFLRRGSTVFPVPTQTAPLPPVYVPVMMPRRKAPWLRRGRVAMSPVVLQGPAPTRRQRRPLGLPRGTVRSAMPPIPQVVVAPPVKVAQNPPKRITRMAVRKGKTSFPVPLQVAAAPPARVPSPGRRRILGLLRRGAPTVAYPMWDGFIGGGGVVADALYFTPPVYPTRRPWATHTAYTVIKRGSVYTNIVSPGPTDVAGADFVYVGGHIYTITPQEATLLVAAGYTVENFTPDLYGDDAYGAGNYGG